MCFEFPQSNIFYYEILYYVLVNNTDASSIRVNHEVRLNQLSEWLVALRTDLEAFITTAHAVTTIIYWVNKVLLLL